MKRSVLVIALMMLSVIGYSQSTLKGPKAKNATASELAVNASPITFNTVPNDLKGPKRKNQKVWKKSEGSTQSAYVRREDKMQQGPKAKNRKVWKD
ncbi:hypothetical protein LV84_03585 [Algoriphagus ratkowskyi]|uniref:Uncharacterized protein n=1 Tax=Algoriphagus ratkowskyi TaxID=57028 RepID=A0A2W7R7W0_9BACT|nr:hypothetical protein [Algoriphagus ratkowskyi]PZX51827.1 hypothetical protein LV84_03585 [Algoriphagus ratkowskyi]TXD76037.1 hypothetical protein ESW18_18240 [Algoriphagus ratkowskyi]